MKHVVKKKMKRPEADLILEKPNKDPLGNLFYHPVILKFAAIGAGAGGILVGIAGYMLAAGIFTTEGLGQAAAGGKDAATFLGFVTGSAIGGLTGSLIGIFRMLKIDKKK